MCNIEVLDTEIGRVVRLSGELAIDSASELKESLLKAFENCSELKLDVSMVESADLACVQVLCAAHRFSVERAKKLALSAPLSPGLLAVMKELALYPSACNAPFDKACLWDQEESHE